MNNERHESAYLACLCLELTRTGSSFEVQKSLPLVYLGVKIDCVYRADLIVEGMVIVEVKSLEPSVIGTPADPMR